MVIFGCWACNRLQIDPLEEALAVAGDNRRELEAALEHFSQREADSLERQVTKPKYIFLLYFDKFLAKIIRYTINFRNFDL